MSIFQILNLLGGLALFLFGMEVMGEALEKKAGSRLKTILEQLTASRVRAFALGLGITAVIQSSSATTVMVVGFVNSGLMQLRQAIGVIMGANVGTTVTAWLLSLTGIEGDSFWVKLLKPSSFSPVLALIGIIFYLSSKSKKTKETGSVLLGFAVLMFGMEAMAGAVKPLVDVPEFANMLILFRNPFFGVLAGALLTAIIQSSSASVGILQAVSSTGVVTFGSAIPIIMGQNIGTCITAMLSSIGANKNARRAAIAHLYFNLIGTLVFSVALYSANAVFSFAFLNYHINQVGIAIVHTSFNLLATALMLPFTRLLERLAYMTVKDTGADESFQILDERLLATPSVALRQCVNVTNDMARLALSAVLRAMRLIYDYREDEARQVQEAEDRTDRYEDILGTYLIHLSQKSLAAGDTNEVSKLLHSIGDFERIGDHALNLSNVALEIHEKKIVFSQEAQDGLRVIYGAVREIVEIAVEAFCTNDLQLAAQVEPLEQVVDNLRAQLKASHINRLQKGECTVELGFVFSDLLTNYERIADHCSNVAVYLLQVKEGSFETHEYLNDVKTSGDPRYLALYEGYKNKYSLPQA
jgi:phosphate:Na+ symporter